jgi:hypothetical protein
MNPFSFSIIETSRVGDGFFFPQRNLSGEREKGRDRSAKKKPR